MLTEGRICARRSKPSTNSAMIWKIFQDSRVNMVSLTGSIPGCLCLSSIVIYPVLGGGRHLDSRNIMAGQV